MQYKFVMFMSWLICHLPYRLTMAMGWLLGNLYYLLIKKERERAIAQMMPALNISEAEARKIVRKSFINLARNVLEILYMPKLNENNFHKYIEIDHLERLQQAMAEKKRCRDIDWSYRYLGMAVGSIYFKWSAGYGYC